MIARYRIKEAEPEQRKPRKKPRPALRKNFTATNVLKLPSKAKQYLIWDAGTNAARGLAILVNPTGTKSYRCVFYYPGSPSPHWMHLGRVGELSLEEARRRCREGRNKAHLGEDPTDSPLTRSENYKAAVENYIEHHQIGKRGNASAKSTQNVMLNNTKDWWVRPVAALRYREVDTLLEHIRDGEESGKKARPYLANRLYSHLKDFFSWCVQKKMLTASPIADMKQPWDGAKRRQRDWFKGAAADEAIKALWRSAEEISGDRGRYLKMLLVTGKRKSAIAGMNWEEIDAYWFWHAPPSRSKNKRLHPIPLPTLAQRILHPRGERGLVFEKLEFEGLQEKIRELSGIKDFIFHGTRHLIESKLAELKVAPHIRDLLFDHVPQRGSGAVYDHYQYRDEMLEALEKWCKHIERLVTPEGVARLR